MVVFAAATVVDNSDKRFAAVDEQPGGIHCRVHRGSKNRKNTHVPPQKQAHMQRFHVFLRGGHVPTGYPV